MKDTLLRSRTADYKILALTGYLCALAVAGVIGWFLPTPFVSEGGHFADSIIAAMLLVVVWGAFHLIQPSRHGQRWLLASLILIPVIWVGLIAALAFWFNHLHSQWEMHEPLHETIKRGGLGGGSAPVTFSNRRIEPMTRSAVTFSLGSDSIDAPLVTAHRQRYE